MISSETTEKKIRTFFSPSHWLSAAEIGGSLTVDNKTNKARDRSGSWNEEKIYFYSIHSFVCFGLGMTLKQAVRKSSRRHRAMLGGGWDMFSI